ncbi:MAG TPA: hypothetical protein VJR89_35570 [Polyangiales bacterium]|nr:hypothetical protein [Polyangiales bacterium]
MSDSLSSAAPASTYRRKVSWRSLAIAACAMAGVFLRVHYALVQHHPRHYVSSDAAAYLERAEKLIAIGARVDLSDTIWPPATSGLWALFSALDASQQLLALWNAAASVLVMLLTAASAALLLGRAAGGIALVLASVHFGFIHYAGYTLAEQSFQLAVALALWLSVSALVRLEGDAVQASPAGRTELTRSGVAGLAVGVAWALATLFRANALPVFAGGALATVLFAWTPRRSRAIAWVVGALCGVLLILGLAAQRCTATSGGRFCVVSNNLAMNFALGQAGTVYGLEFDDRARPDESTAWVPPALLHHGYTGMRKVPASIYDSAGVLRWVGARFVHAPGAFVVRAIGNVLDMFGLAYWPHEYGRVPERVVTVWAQLFFALVFIPALWGASQLLRRAWRRQLPRAAAAFVLGCLGGLAASALVSLGEARYRVPFDGIWIALAAAVFVGNPALQPSSAPARTGTRAWGVWAAALFGIAAVLLGLTHPAVNRTGLAVRTAVLSPPAATVQRAADSFSRPRAPETAWDAPGNFVWRCEPSCPELRLRFGAVRAVARVSLSLDHNDRYRVSCYRDGRALGHVDIPMADGPPGLHVVEVAAPDACASSDALGVLPLYGDGHYSLGHLRALQQ